MASKIVAVADHARARSAGEAFLLADSVQCGWCFVT